MKNVLRLNYFLVFAILLLSTSWSFAQSPCSGSNQSGTISLENSSGAAQLNFAAGTTMYIKVTDNDRNTNCNAADQFTVKITSETETLGETITLVETGNNTSIYKNSIGFNVSTSESQNGYVDVQKGES